MTLPEREIQRLQYIAESIERVERYLPADQEHFVRDVFVQDAVLRRLETLTDAASKLPDDLKRRQPSVSWQRMKSFRNVAAHAYEELEMLRIWDIISDHLPALKAAVAEELHRVAASDTDDQPPSEA